MKLLNGWFESSTESDFDMQFACGALTGSLLSPSRFCFLQTLFLAYQQAFNLLTFVIRKNEILISTILPFVNRVRDPPYDPHESTLVTDSLHSV